MPHTLVYLPDGPLEMAALVSEATAALAYPAAAIVGTGGFLSTPAARPPSGLA